MPGWLEKMVNKIFYTISLFSFVMLLLWVTACEKEYSYEGGNTIAPGLPAVPVDSTNADSTNTADSTQLDPGEIPSCNLCNTGGSTPEYSWSFKTGNSFLCGEVDTAFILNLERSSFTFFGPATCGTDTGLIFTVSLGPNSLNKDIDNISATNAVFYYYHTNAPYIITSNAGQPFNLVISSYNNTTKIATGTFNGLGSRQDGRNVNVIEGLFKIKLI